MDPALSQHIEPPAPFYRRRTMVAVPLLLWVAAAVFVLGRGEEPSLPLLLGLLCIGVGLLLAALPLTLSALRELVGSLRVLGDNRAALAALGEGALSGAEQHWRRALGRARMTPSSRAVVVHNLGVAALLRGDLTRARALMDHALASGWVSRFVLRRQRAVLHQGRATLAVAEGDFARAAADLALARQAPLRPAHRAYLQLTELALLDRQERLDGAMAVARALDPTPMAPRDAACARLAKAYLLARTGAAGDELARALADLELPPPAELPWVPAWWPGLRVFASEHGLLPPQES